jgi:integrase
MSLYFKVQDMKSKNLAEWIGTYATKNTRSSYLTGAKKFLTCIYGGEYDKTDEEYETLTSRFINECANGRNWFKDLIDFATSFEGSPPKTAKVNMAGAKGFIEYVLDIEVSKKQLRQLRGRMPKGKRAWTVEGEMTKEKLRRILMHCDAKGNALFMLLATSGIRVGEALKLNLWDVELESDPVKVVVHGANAKEGDNYYSFISSEAKEAVNEWLKIRDSYKHTAKNRGRGLSKLGDGKGVRKSDDRRLFPFSMGVANSMWVRAIEKANLDSKDESTNRHKFHIHMLRKFFQSQMKYAGVPDDLVEALIGHNGYLDEAYRRYSPTQIKEMYKKGEPYLLLNVDAEERIKNDEKFDEQKKRIEELTYQLNDINRKLTDSNSIMIQFIAEKDRLTKKVESLETLYTKLFEMRPEELRLLLQEIDRLLHQRQKAEDKRQFTNS